MILTATGASGSGKSTITKYLLEKLSGHSNLVVSHTTRQPRESDLPGEYAYLNENDFDKLKDTGEFLWYVSVHGNRYGTTKSSVEKAFIDQSFNFMIILDNAAQELWQYAKEKGQESHLKSFYINYPGADILRQRLKLRGDNDEEIEKRIEDCKIWDEKAKSSEAPYIFINNNTSVENSASFIMAALLLHIIQSRD